ncbi:MAG: DUF2318 domain-containing protein [Clostridia bacterium]|nr:DUF2318 domain-containing protein [Clostridia bacterium]
MSKKNKKTTAQREKRFTYLSIIIFVVGVIALTAVFLHFDIFTYKSVFFEYNEYELAVNEKMKENTHIAEVDPYGDVFIPKSLISSQTISYFEAEEYGERILAFNDGIRYRLAYDRCHKCEDGWFYEYNGYLHCSACGQGIELSELGKENPSSEVYPVPITKDMYEERASVLAVIK